MKSKNLIFISMLLLVLIGLSTVSAEENLNDVDMTLGDSNSITPVYVDSWAKLKSYCENDNDQIIYLNGNFSIDSQINIKNNVNIIGDSNYYIGGTENNVNTYSNVSFLCSNALNVTFTNVNFQYASGKSLMQFDGNGNLNIENCNFKNLNSGSDRSIILLNSGLTNIVCSNFSDCNVQRGVIINNANLTVRKSGFENNVATMWAGAIHTNAYATTTLYNSIFKSNRAGWNGGALYTYSNLYIYNCNFIDNNCTTNNGGGAIGACKLGTSEPYLYVVNSTFINNINTCKYLDNLSTTGLGRGGAISFMDDGTLKVYDSTFIGNDAKIGSAICALSQGSYGSPDVEIVGNNFINHTGVGSDVLVVSLSNSNYIVENNIYLNNNIDISKFKLDIDDNDGVVTVDVNLKVKHPDYYDSDIITESGFDVYVDNVYNKTVYDTTFTLNFADNINHNIKVIPRCLNISKSKNINDAKYNTIYVSTTGSDNNNGITRNTAVRTISKAIELAQNDVDYIKLLEGTYYERDLIISYEKTIEGEGNVILMGNSSNINTFNVNSGNVEFNNLQFTGITGGKAINTADNFVVSVNNCSFYSNNVANRIIDVYELEIKDSTINDNIAHYAIYTTKLNMENCDVYENSLKLFTTTSYGIVYTTEGNIYNSTFSNNNGRYGILRISGSTVNINESKFINNTVKSGISLSYGGAIYAASTDNINIVSSVFYNNYAYSNGGAIYLTNTVKNLNITNSVLIGNTAKSFNYQIGRQGSTSNIFAVNNWWGNTIDDAYVAPTFQNNNNVNASIWLILNVTSNVTSLSLGESALVTFDLTYTNILGSDSNDTTGNLTPFCIDGIYLPILDGVLTSTNGVVNVSDVSLVDGKVNIVFTATNTNPYLTINIFGISENIYFDDIGLFGLNEVNSISLDNIKINNIISSKKSAQNEVLGLGLNPDEWNDVYAYAISPQIFIFNDVASMFVIIEEEAMFNWMDDEEYGSFIEEIPEDYLNGENNVHINLSLYNSTTGGWDEVVKQSFFVPFPGATTFPSFSNPLFFFNIIKGLYKFSLIYDGQDINYDYEDGSATFHYRPLNFEFELNLDITSSIDNLNSIVSYENNVIFFNPTVSYVYSPSEFAEEHYDDDGSGYALGGGILAFDDSFSLEHINEVYEYVLDDSAYNADDLPVKQINITMTVTQGDKVIKEFSVAPGDSYSLEGLTTGEYNLTAVYDDPYYGYDTKTVSITVKKNIWENIGADEGYSHRTDYYGPKNVEELWNLSVSNFQPSVIDSDGNVYVVNGSNVLVVSSGGNLIKTLAIKASGFSGLTNAYSTGLALYNNYLICSVYSDSMISACVWDISNNYAQSNFPFGSYSYEGDAKSTTTMYSPVVANGKVYITSWEFYSGKDHIYEWTTDTHSNNFARSTGAPSIDSEGYIYVNTRNGLVILDPELNILNLSFGDAGKFGRPVIDNADIVYVFNSDRTKVYAINREADNPILWTAEISGGACDVMAADVENNALYIVGNDSVLYKLNRATGEISEFYNPGTTASSIMVDARGTVYLGGDDGVLYGVTNEGKTLFKYDLGSPISKDMVLNDNGTLFVYADSKLYALNGAPRLYSEISINVSDVEVNRNNTIVAILPENATGNVTFIIDDTITSENITIINGNATWSAPGLLEGPHTLKAIWVGDDEYFGSDATAKFNAYKVNSTIDLKDSINYVGKQIQLNITLPGDAVGNVSVTFNRKTESVKIVNGTATFETTPLEAGNYTIDFSWDGDDRYFGNSSYGYFTVIKNDAVLTIAAEPVKEGDNLKVTVTVRDDASGIILINVGDINDYAQIKDGKAEFIISGLTADDYDINARYIGDNKYYNASETSQVSVLSKVEVSISINPDVIVENNMSSIEITLPDDATGSVLVEVNGIVFYVDVDGGVISVPVLGLEANKTHFVSVSYSGDDKYLSGSQNGEVTTPFEEIVEPKDPELTATSVNTTVSISMNSDVTGNVYVDIGGKGFYAEIKDGHATVEVSGLEAGKTYAANVRYDGDEIFKADNITVTINVPTEPVVEPKDSGLHVVVTNTTIDISVNSDATGYVFADVDGKGYYAPVKNGKATINIVGLDAGNYTVAVSYSGDDNYAASNANALISVPENDTPSQNVTPVGPVDSKADIKATNKTVDVTLPADAGGFVIVDVDGSAYYAPVKDGKVTIDLPELAPGNHTVNVIYTGDSKYQSTTATEVISIEKALETIVSNDLIKVEKGSQRFGANFTDANGNPLSGKNVTFEVAGVTYTRTTNTNGRATIPMGLISGNYTVKITNPETGEVKTNNITILNRIVENNDVEMFYRNGSQYIVRVVDDNGNPVGINETVSFNINGILYERKTNANGYARINLGLAPGDYVVTTEYKGCKASNNIKVKPVLSAVDLTKKFGTSDQFKVNLVDGQGKALAGAKIAFNINGVMYERTTNADGVAKMNIKLQAGEYIITSTYNGASISNKVTVTA